MDALKKPVVKADGLGIVRRSSSKNHMSGLTTTAPKREIAPLGFGSQSVGTQLVRVAQEGGKQISVLLGRWEMLVAYFKHGLEIPLCLDSKNQDLIEQHRMILTSAMGMGELLIAKTKSLEDGELKALGYSKEFVESNLRYLRETYEQWYVARDKEIVESDFKSICDAFATSH